MKKQIPYIVALAFMIAVAVLAFLDGLTWSRERMRSAYLDGCMQGDRIYLVENMENMYRFTPCEERVRLHALTLETLRKHRCLQRNREPPDNVHNVLRKLIGGYRHPDWAWNYL